MWVQLPCNQEEGQPCTFGCIIKQRVEEPKEYVLVGDCRVPASEDCCMNQQDRRNSNEQG
jgi:hypothetical protein